MTLSPGTRLGHYEIEDTVGAGGMGEVYRARDTRLDRHVALKVVPQAFVLDVERLARFKREAQVLALLNHPNIAAIYGFEEADGIQALVLEFVDGLALNERIAQGVAERRGQSSDPPIPLDEALAIALQIAEALEGAHEQGIIHRDLKPANIKLRSDGTVKVLDFGLAKALGREQGQGDAAHYRRRESDSVDHRARREPDMTASPTITTPAVTQVGVILGTAAYMSPEQAKGRPADKRGDIWAFGCVLYEMLTGTRAFGPATGSGSSRAQSRDEGEDIADTMAAVIRATPDWTRLPPGTPQSIRRLLRRCLEKDRKERLPHIGAARIEVKETLASLDVEMPAVVTPAVATSSVAASAVAVPIASSRPRARLAWLVAGVMTLAAVALGLLAFRAARDAPEMRVELVTPPTSDPVALAVSPDGRRIVFAGISDGQPLLWLRSLDSTDARPLPGTSRGRVPFWSADSRSIGFFSDGIFKRLDVETGSTRDLVKVVTSTGGTSNRDGVILFGMGNLQPVYRVSGDATEPMPITRNAPGTSHRFPRFLPDGRHFFYTVAGNPRERGVLIGALDGSEPRRLLDDVESQAEFAAGHLFYLLGDTLVAHPFDPVQMVLSGEPVRLAQGVAVFSVSASGTIAYRTGVDTGLGAPGVRQLEWLDRSGHALGTLADAQTAGPPALSPDGQRAVIYRAGDIWTLDTTRSGRIRLSSNPENEAFPVWSPDGETVAFQSYQKGVGGEIYRKSASTPGPEELVLSTTEVTHPMDWSPDGRFLLYRTQPQGSNTSQWNLWAAPVDGSSKPFPVVQTNFDERDGQFSPDGNWIAFESNETGRYEIYLQPFPGPGSKIPVSASGGAQVRWRRDGHELFYIALDGQLMSVPIQFEGNGQPTIGAAVPLFMTNVGGAIAQGVTRQQYAVSADGQRFLMHTLVSDANASPITLILNWGPKP